jgi:hypothetical protein
MRNEPEGHPPYDDTRKMHSADDELAGVWRESPPWDGGHQDASIVAGIHIFFCPLGEPPHTTAIQWNYINSSQLTSRWQRGRQHSATLGENTVWPDQ